MLLEDTIMPAKVTLTVTRGKLQGQAFAFDERTTCIVGRGKDCQPQVPNDQDHKTISRHHCLLDINPPDIRVRDFGSLNGTYVNGQKIGQRDKGMKPEEGARMSFPEHDLKDGDEITLGCTVFQVSVFVPTVCTDCSVEIPEGQKAAAERAPGIYQCRACHQKAITAQRKEPAKKRKACAKCGKDVSAEMGENRQGYFVCSACQGDPMEIARHLLRLARSGSPDLLAIQDYEILKELGRGGMGAVYLARHQKTHEQVALKVMLPRVAANPSATRRFLLEAEFTRALKHPHIVELREAGCSEGTFFFTLEFCPGGSVDRLVAQRGGRLPIEEATAITFQILDGLDHAHRADVRVKLPDGTTGEAKGLVHRDLKPQNIFLAGAGNRVAKVGDYGLAKAFDAAGLSGHTYSDTVAGTPAFMPRQQVINFKYVKPEVDVWAAAASLYFMLTGLEPRDFSSGADWYIVVLQSDAVPIRERNPAIPKRLAEVIDHALIDKPSIGFKTAAEFRAALDGAL